MPEKYYIDPATALADRNDFLNMRDALAAYQAKNTKVYVQAILSIETGVQDKKELDYLYSQWIADGDAPLINPKFTENYKYRAEAELSQEKFEKEIAAHFVDAADYAYYFLDQEDLKEDDEAQEQLHQWFENEANSLIFDSRFEIVRDNDRYILQNKNIDYHNQNEVIEHLKTKHVFEDVLSQSQIAEELYNFTTIRDRIHQAFEQAKIKSLSPAPKKGRTR